jgi:predicted DNA-binding protein (MmcQ/YjbR family)
MDSVDMDEEECFKYKIFYLNLQKLVSWDLDLENVSVLTRKISRGNSYNIINSVLAGNDYIDAELINSLYQDLVKSQTKDPNFTRFKKYFKTDLVEFARVYSESLASGDTAAWQKFLQQKCEEQKAELLKNIELIRQHGNKLHWQTKNPGSQLSGSFNPIMTTRQEWYGQYYREI